MEEYDEREYGEDEIKEMIEDLGDEYNEFAMHAARVLFGAEVYAA